MERLPPTSSLVMLQTYRESLIAKLYGVHGAFKTVATWGALERLPDLSLAPSPISETFCQIFETPPN